MFPRSRDGNSNPFSGKKGTEETGISIPFLPKVMDESFFSSVEQFARRQIAKGRKHGFTSDAKFDILLFRPPV